MLIRTHFLSLLPKVFGPILNIRCCWKPLTYKMKSGLLQYTLVSLSFIQIKYEMQGFLSMCPKGCFFANHLFADSYRKTNKQTIFEMVHTILVKSSGTFLDVASALKLEGTKARCW